MRLSSLSSTSKTVFPFPFMRVLTADADDPVGLSVSILAVRYSDVRRGHGASGTGMVPNPAGTSSQRRDQGPRRRDAPGPPSGRLLAPPPEDSKILTSHQRE